MPMPKGHKSKFGYATVKSFSGGADYRSIAEEMTRSGYKMNHATARNVYIAKLCSLSKVEKFVSEGNDGKGFVYKGPKVKPLDKKEQKDEKGTILK